MTPCPCCGQPVDTDDLLVSLETNTISRRGIVRSLSPTQIELLCVLNKARPKPVAREQLENALYGKSSLNSCASYPGSVVRVGISKMRKSLRAMGVEIKPVYGVGYQMVVS